MLPCYIDCYVNKKLDAKNGLLDRIKIAVIFIQHKFVNFSLNENLEINVLEFILKYNENLELIVSDKIEVLCIHKEDKLDL